MSDAYTKLFSSITKSTIWSEPMATRIVWITMLAGSNRSGEYYASIPGLARDANVSLGECEAALATLLAPDPYSRTPDHEGRRIVPIDRGWQILNFAKFDRQRSEIEAEERERERKREWDRANRPSGYARATEQDQSDESPTKVRRSPTQSDDGPTQSVPPPTATASTEEQDQKRQRDNVDERPAAKPGRDGRRGTRLPDGWQPSESVLAWAKGECPGVNIRSALDEFRDYWCGVAGQKGIRLDWDATFRNRLRTLAERAGRGGAARARASPTPMQRSLASLGFDHSPPQVQHDHHRKDA